MLKSIKLWLAGRRLDRQIKNGTAPRGRTAGFVAPKRTFGVRVRSWLKELGLRLRVVAAGLSQLNPWAGEVTPVGRLYIRKITPHGVEDLGLVSTRVVTTAGVGFIVDAFQNLTEVENFKYHGSGTGVAAEASSDTALGTEVASRATGTTTEGASANIYKTVGTVAYSGTFAITEHGVFSAASVGTLLDRSVFAAINVQSGDSIEFTYELTFPAGS